jgi:glycosyltransferase involved in cell wall biosynthesis
LHILNRASYGGAENHVLILMKGQRAAGHDVLYAGYSDGWLANACREHGITVLPFRRLGLNNFISILRLCWFTRRYGVDIVHGHSVRGARYAGFVGALHRRPVSICTAHSERALKQMGGCRQIIAVSQSLLQSLLTCGYPENKISVICNGVPEWVVGNRNQLRRELGIPDNVYAVVHAGRFSNVKGQDLLLRASEHCPPQMHFYFIGDHQTAFGQQVQAQVHDRSRIHFLGYRGDVQRLLPAFDAFAFPSRREALGLSIIEASAASLPIVATSVGGIPEVIINEKTGLLVPPEQPLALAEALVRLQTDAALSKRLGQNARERYLSHFTVDEMVQSTVDVYRRCLGENIA